ncbi:hypothetical protein ACVWWG_001783 [Bradyrhizobium sp. LB7.2]
MVRICRYRLWKVPMSGDERPFKIAFLHAVATAHAYKQGSQVQLNPGWLGPIPIVDVTSIVGDREWLTFRFSFGRTEGKAVECFHGRPGVYAFVLRRMVGAVSGLASVQASTTVNRHNLSEAVEDYLQLSSIGMDPFNIKPMFAARRHTQQPKCAFAALPSLQPATPRPRSSCNSHLPDGRPLAGQSTSCESTGLRQEHPINIECYAGQPHASLADAA